MAANGRWFAQFWLSLLNIVCNHERTTSYHKDILAQKAFQHERPYPPRGGVEL